MEIDTGCPALRATAADGVGRIEIVNPKQHNALTAEIIRAVPRVVETLDEDPAVRAIVVSGAGDRAFVSGAAINESLARDKAAGGSAEHEAALQRFWDCWELAATPVIAMIDGYCLGGGLSLALRADIRWCSDRSAFGVPAVRIGRPYPLDAVKRLVDVVGPSWAAEMLLSGRRLSADEAAAAGLVSRVFAAEKLPDAVTELATEQATTAPLAIAAIKRALVATRRGSEAADRDVIEELNQIALSSRDFVEGRQAFLEKRPPKFRGE